MLKHVKYSFNGPENGEVAYMRTSQWVFFSALTSTPSSVNAAENIVQAIATAEGINWKEFVFCDIQTHRGYRRLRPEQREVNRLTIELRNNNVFVSDWRPYEPSETVLAEFEELINA